MFYSKLKMFCFKKVENQMIRSLFDRNKAVLRIDPIFHKEYSSGIFYAS
jgi:hypothetical protein